MSAYFVQVTLINVFNKKTSSVNILLNSEVFAFYGHMFGKNYFGTEWF